MKRVVAIVGVALVAILLVIGLRLARSPSPATPAAAGPAPWRFAIPGGLRRDWLVEIRSEAALDLALGSADPERPVANQLKGRHGKVTTATTARLQARFFADPAGGWIVGARLRDASRAQQGGRAVAPELLEAPFTFQLSTQGAVSGFRFTPGLPDEARSVVSEVVRGLRVSLPQGRAEGWSAEEQASGGTRRVAYAVRPGASREGTIEVTTRLQAFLPASEEGAAGGFLRGARYVVVDASGEATASLPAWTDRSSFTETLSLEVGAAVVARTTVAYAARAVDPADAAALPETFAAFQALMSDPRWVAMVYRQTDPELDRIGAPLALEGALARFLDLQKTDPRGAERFLVNFLRQKPEMAEKLLRLLDRDRDQVRIPESTQLVLWRLVVEAGTPEAQRAVAKALLDRSYGYRSHARALLYAVDFENPGSELVEALWTSHRNPIAPPGTRDVDLDRNMSILAIGGVGWREHQDAATRDAVASSLAANLVESRQDPVEVAATLKAIGNTGNDALIPSVRPLLAAGDEKVRAAACDALRRMEGAEAQALLVAAASRDGAAAVRERALQALREGQPDQATVSWARERVGRASSVREQVLTIEILGRSLGRHPASEAALRSLLVPGADPIVVEAVYRFIAPRNPR